MSIVNWITDKFQSVNIPSVGTIRNSLSPYRSSSPNISYLYDDMTKLLEDERIYSIVSLTASMIRDSYTGIKIDPKDSYKDDELDATEQKALKYAEQFAKNIQLKSLIYTYAWNVLAYGDYIERFNTSGEGVTRLKSLPLNNVTIIEDRGNINKIDKPIFEANHYLINESKFGGADSYTSDEIIHVSYNNRGQWRKDILNRDTYGIYSVPPIAVLKKLVDWKNETISNDKKWKRKMVPREHWEVDTATINPNNFSGTPDEKIDKAQKHIDSLIDKVQRVVDTPNPDQSIVTNQTVKSKVLEASSVSYAEPNNVLNQINESLGAPTGTPSAYLGGDSAGYAGLTAINNLAGIRIEPLAEKIALAFEKLIRKHLSIAHSNLGSAVINRILINIDTKSIQLKLETSRILLNFVKTELFTKSELRGIVGYGPLSQEPYKVKMDERLIRDNIDQVTADGDKEVPNNDLNNSSPQAEVNQLT